MFCLKLFLLKFMSVYFQGCYVLYTSPISKIAFRLISLYQMDRKIFSGVTLGNCDSKVEQLKLVANTLWRHTGTFSSHEMNPWYLTYLVNTKSTFVLLFEFKKKSSNITIYFPYISFRVIDTVLAVGNFMRLLEVLGRVFVNDAKQFAEDIMSLKLLLTKKEAIDDVLWENLTSEITSLPLEVLLPNYQEVVTALMTSCKRCSEGIENAPVRKLAFRNGEIFMLAGLLQTFLLAPQGPVDPVEKQQFQLTYAEQEVSLISKIKRFLNCRSIILYLIASIATCSLKK